MISIEQAVKNEEKREFYHDIIVKNKIFSDRLVLDLSRTGGLYAMFAIKAHSSKCFVLVDGIEYDSVKKFAEANGCFEKVTLVKSLSEVDTQVHIIIHDCTNLNILSNFHRLFEVVNARQMCLKDGGLIIPEDVCIFLHGVKVNDERQLNDIFHCTWTLPYEINYRFMNTLVPREVMRIGSESISGTTEVCLLRQFKLHKLSSTLDVTNEFIVPFLLKPKQACKIHAFVFDFEATSKVTSQTYPGPNTDEINIFPLPYAISVGEKEHVMGIFTMSLDEANDISMAWKISIQVKHPIQNVFKYRFQTFIFEIDSVYHQQQL